MSVDAVVDFDPFSQEMHDDPYPAYKYLRDHAPVYHTTKYSLEFWALSRYDDVLYATREHSIFSNRDGGDLDHTDSLIVPNHVADVDPPEHDVLRALIQPWFGPKRLRTLVEPQLRQRVENIVKELANTTPLDADKLAWDTAMSAAQIMHAVPSEDLKRLEAWMRPVFRREAGDPSVPLVALYSGKAICEYMREHIEVVKNSSTDEHEDIINMLLQSTVNGEPPTDDQMNRIVPHLIIGQSGTTQDLICRALHCLASHPDQRRWLAEHPEGIPNAIEEVLRFASPVQHLRRVTNQEVELHGVKIPRYATVLLLFASANRDERNFEDPDVFNIRRTPGLHFSLSYGIHHCVGAPLARMETRLVLEEVLKQIPEYEISEVLEGSHIGGSLRSLFSDTDKGTELSH